MGEATLDQLRAFTETLYLSLHDEDELPSAMRQLKAMFDSDGMAFGLIAQNVRDSSILYGDCGDEHTRMFFDPSVQNPFLPVMPRQRPGEFFTDASLMGGDEFRKTTFFNEWLRPQGQSSMLSLKIVEASEQFVLVGMQKGDGGEPFDTQDKTVLDTVLPALQSYSKARVRLGAMRLRERMHGYDTLQIGFAVLNADCQILTHNEAAEAIFANPLSGVKATGGRIELIEQLPRNQLKRMVGEACIADIIDYQSGDIVIHGMATGFAELLITVIPMPDAGLYGIPATRAAGVFFQPVAPPLDQGFEQRISIIFGLTRKEAALAAALVAGRTLKDAAEERFISIATARTQLAQIFRKTNTDQQSQLVALLRGLPTAPRW